MMATIEVVRFYEVPEETRFVLVGKVQGSVSAKDVIRIPVKRILRLTMINRVKILENEVEIHLVITPHSAESLRNLPIIGKTFEIETLETSRFRILTARFFGRAQRLGNHHHPRKITSFEDGVS